jgi:uncharacterized protein (DUF736 family)
MSEYDNTNQGALFKVDEQKSEKHPGYTGTLNVEGREFWLSGWVNESKSGKKYLSLKVKAKDEQARPAPAPVELDDDIPF